MTQADPSASFRKLERRDPKWLTSFADMMSLLFAMFVLLLSMADFNKTEFDKNSAPIAEAFDAKIKPKDPKPIPTADKPMVIDLGHPVTQLAPPPPLPEDTTAEDMVEKLRFVLEQEITRDMVEVLQRDDVVVIRFRDRAAFAVGDRELAPSILPTLTNVANIIARTPGRLRVEGHTDDVPINTMMFRSNWDLSAARAASVVHFLLQAGAIDPSRVSAEGFADSRPLVPNDSPQNRAINRRVELLIELKGK